MNLQSRLAEENSVVPTDELIAALRDGRAITFLPSAQTQALTEINTHPKWAIAVLIQQLRARDAEIGRLDDEVERLKGAIGNALL